MHCQLAFRYAMTLWQAPVWKLLKSFNCHQGHEGIVLVQEQALRHAEVHLQNQIQG